MAKSGLILFLYLLLFQSSELVSKKYSRHWMHIWRLFHFNLWIFIFLIYFSVLQSLSFCCTNYLPRPRGNPFELTLLFFWYNSNGFLKSFLPFGTSQFLGSLYTFLTYDLDSPYFPRNLLKLQSSLTYALDFILFRLFIHHSLRGGPSTSHSLLDYSYQVTYMLLLFPSKNIHLGASLAVQWLRFHASNHGFNPWLGK